MFYEYVNILNKGQGDISIINSCKWFQYFATSEKISINENILCQSKNKQHIF